MKYFTSRTMLAFSRSSEPCQRRCLRIPIQCKFVFLFVNAGFMYTHSAMGVLLASLPASSHSMYVLSSCLYELEYSWVFASIAILSLSPNLSCLLGVLLQLSVLDSPFSAEMFNAIFSSGFVVRLISIMMKSQTSLLKGR